MRHLTDLPLEPLGREHLGQLAAQRAIQDGDGVPKLRRLGIEAHHERIGLDGRERADRDGDLHARSPRLSATARRIMSASPSVIGSRSTSSIFTQRTSAASLPAVIVSSDSGKAR